jgi:hypothetical protein
MEEQIVEVVADLAADLDRVTKALGGDQADLGALSLDDGIGNQGRSMHDGAHRGDDGLRFAEKAGDALDDGETGITRRCQALARVDELLVAIDEHEIGERAPDVHPDPHALACAATISVDVSHWRRFLSTCSQLLTI